MKVLKRKERVFKDGIRFTYKLMENGEGRRRFVFPSGDRVSRTDASNWGLTDSKFPWQDIHYHRGLTEHYFVQRGWVVFLFEKEARLEWQKVEAGGHICFEPNVPHAVLMGPEAVMATMLVGIPVGNPNRKNDDWWPFERHVYIWELEMLRVEGALA
jgi:hypothetical protein